MNWARICRIGAVKRFYIVVYAVLLLGFHANDDSVINGIPVRMECSGESCVS